jgi:hypothetical protein
MDRSIENLTRAYLLVIEAVCHSPTAPNRKRLQLQAVLSRLQTEITDAVETRVGRKRRDIGQESIRLR